MYGGVEYTVNLKKLYKLSKYLHAQVVQADKRVSAGGVVVNDEGKIALVKPSGGFGGYEWTYPKGGQEQGETLEQTALREVQEEAGLIGKIIAPLGKFKGTSSFTYYFLMKLEHDTGHHDWETEKVEFVTPEKARGMLNSGRDQKVLDTALQNWSKIFKRAKGSYKVTAINRRRFFVKKLLNFLSQDSTKNYTRDQIAKYLDADMEKVNYALIFLTESGIIRDKDGVFGVAKSTASHRGGKSLTSKKEQTTTDTVKAELETEYEQLRREADEEFKSGKTADLFEFLNDPEKFR